MPISEAGGRDFKNMLRMNWGGEVLRKGVIWGSSKGARCKGFTSGLLWAAGNLHQHLAKWFRARYTP